MVDVSFPNQWERRSTSMCPICKPQQFDAKSMITPVNNLDQQKHQGVLRMSHHPSLKSFPHKYFRQNYHSLARISLILSSPVNPSGDIWKVKCLVNLTRSTTFWIRSFIYIYVWYVCILYIRRGASSQKTLKSNTRLCRSTNHSKKFT